MNFDNENEKNDVVSYLAWNEIEYIEDENDILIFGNMPNDEMELFEVV